MNRALRIIGRSCAIVVLLCVTTISIADISAVYAQSPIVITKDEPLYDPDPQVYNPYEVGENAAEFDVPSAQIVKEVSAERFLLRVINWLLAFLGIVAFIHLIMAGFIYATALDKDESAKKARDMVLQVVIGTIIVLAAYSIVFTILSGTGRLFFY